MNYTCYSSLSYSSSQAQTLFGVAINQLRDSFFTSSWVCLRSGQYTYVLLVKESESESGYKQYEYNSSSGRISTIQYSDEWFINYNGYTYLSNTQTETYASYPVDFFNAHLEHISLTFISIITVVSLVFSVLSLMLKKLF